MRITVCGAAGGEVTGSCYLVETTRARVLVDCGMFQGRGSVEARNSDLGPVDPVRVDAAVLTHAHLDHCGRFGLLGKRGYRAPIHATPATVDFARLVLEDSARIQENDAARENKYREREGRPPVTPLYSVEDLHAIGPCVRTLGYGEQRTIAEGISIRLFEAGHILGSASVEMVIEDRGTSRTVVFSADIGRWGTPILRDPDPPRQADIVFLESTYGDRDHRPAEATLKEFREIIHRAIWQKEKILIPAFSIGRTQLILHALSGLIREGTLPRFPIYLDSPMAIKATKLYSQHADLFDAEAAADLERRAGVEDVPGLRFIESPEESRELNDRHEPCIIIAGGGMCDGGRIVHHLRHHVWRRGVAVVMVGYAATGSLGHALIRGDKQVRIFRDMVPVRATIHTLGGFSAHAGQSELIRWLEPMAAGSPNVYLTHGENPQREALAEKIKQRWELSVALPELNQTFEIG
ncbi:MAG: MBL fold metallo-hydrolase [Phycisphaerae bacterium]|nr:MBL fold metallo-hydrolase [Phycisphaerae bacterium]